MDKASLRAQMKQYEALEPGRGSLVTAGLFAWLSRRLPGTVSAFLAMPDEVDVSPLFTRLAGWRWVLPRVEEDRTLTFRDRDVPRETHRLGMEQPADEGPIVPLAEIDVLLVPGLAFDRSGARLGRGGGYYDRILAHRRHDASAVGVTVLRRMIDSVPTDDRDQRVDWLASEEGVTECFPRM